MATTRLKFRYDEIHVLAACGWDVRDRFARKHLDFDITARLNADGRFAVMRQLGHQVLTIHHEPAQLSIDIDDTTHLLTTPKGDVLRRAGEAEYRALHYLEAITDLPFAWRLDGPGRGWQRLTPAGHVTARQSPYDDGVIRQGRVQRLRPWPLDPPNHHQPEPIELVAPSVYRAIAPAWRRVPSKVRAIRVDTVDGATRQGWVREAAPHPVNLEAMAASILDHDQPLQ